jgi:hypothetical protein
MQAILRGPQCFFDTGECSYRAVPHILLNACCGDTLYYFQQVAEKIQGQPEH